MDKRDIKELSHEEIISLMDDLEQPTYRAKQLEEWLYAKGCSSFDDISVFPKGLREELSRRFFISRPRLVARQESSDGTVKYLFELSDGAFVETVAMPSEDRTKLSVCFSSQAGCPMGCAFCATGKAGFNRNLSSAEMFDQVKAAGEDMGIRVSSVVCMGQGEPFLNYENTLEALRKMNSAERLDIGARHITISTCGLVDGIEKFETEPEQFTLAISLHSAIQKTRNLLMPGVSKTSLEDLHAAIKHYGDTTKRRPSLEYAPIAGINDDEEHIEALIQFCKGMLCHVNLIPFNEVPNNNKGMTFTASPRLKEIADELTAHGIENSIRRSRGADIDGACGQLHNSISNK